MYNSAQASSDKAEPFLQVGMITSYFDIEAVMLAFLTTCVAVGVLTIIACQERSCTEFM